MTEWCVSSENGKCANLRCRYNLASCREDKPYLVYMKGNTRRGCEGFQKPKAKAKRKK